MLLITKERKIIDFLVLSDSDYRQGIENDLEPMCYYFLHKLVITAMPGRYPGPFGTKIPRELLAWPTGLREIEAGGGQNP